MYYKWKMKHIYKKLTEYKMRKVDVQITLAEMLSHFNRSNIDIMIKHK